MAKHSNNRQGGKRNWLSPDTNHLVCPSCKSGLPFWYAFAAGDRKKTCPGCHSWLKATSASLEKIHRDCGLISFIAGIPLGGLVYYIWAWMAQPLVALLMLWLGVAGVVHSCYLHARATIRFLPDPPFW